MPIPLTPFRSLAPGPRGQVPQLDGVVRAAKTGGQGLPVGREAHGFSAARVGAERVEEPKGLWIPKFIGAVFGTADGPSAVGRVEAAVDLGAELVSVGLEQVAENLSGLRIPKNKLPDVS